MKLRLPLKMLLIEIILESKATMNQITTKNPVMGILQIRDPCFNPKTAKDVTLSSSRIICFLHFLNHFPLLLEARNKIIWLYTKETKITNENPFNQDLFWIDITMNQIVIQKLLFRVFLQICDSSFNHYTPKDIYLRFSSITWLSQILSLFSISSRS